MEKIKPGDRVITKSGSIIWLQPELRNAVGTVLEVCYGATSHTAKVEFSGFLPFWMRMCDLTKEAAE